MAGARGRGAGAPCLRACGGAHTDGSLEAARTSPAPPLRARVQTDLRQASTAARIAYCAAVLEQAAEPMLAALSKAASKASGGKKGGKGAGGKGAGSGKGAAAGSRPVSRTNSVANLEAAAAAAGGSKGAGKSGGGGKRKAPAPLPENMRQTRSRH